MPTITFSEDPIGTNNPVFEFENNTVRTNGIVVPDGAQPQSPVLAANRSYDGPVFAFFAEPVTTVNFDVGFFDNLNSTRILFRDQRGRTLESVTNDALGVLNFEHTDEEVGIASIAAIDIARDVAGFSLDTIEFGDPIEDPEPPAVRAVDGGTVEIDFDVLDEGTSATTERLGPDDQSDVIRVSVDSPGTATVTTWLRGRPEDTRTFDFTLEEGEQLLDVFADTAYAEPTGYGLGIRFTPTKSSDEQAVDDFIDDTFAKIFKTVVFDYKKFQADLAEVVLQNVDNADDAARMMGKLGKVFGFAGLAFDVSNRVDNIANARDFRRQLVVETTDFIVGTGLTAGATAGISFVGTPLAGVLGGFVTNLVYTLAVSDIVREEAGEFYDDQAGAADNFPSAALAADAVVQALELPEGVDLEDLQFDPDYYAEQHPEAAEAVAEGRAGSLLSWYLNNGIQAGHQPNANADPIEAEELAFDNEQINERSVPQTAVFTQGIGELAGDTLSPAERALADELNGQRTEGSALAVNAQLSAIANRIARDWVQNNAEGPLAASAGVGPEAWAATLSNGDPFTQVLAGLPGLELAQSDGELTGLSVVAVATGETSADELIRALSAGPAAADALFSFDNESVGVGQFGGVWVLVLSTDALSDDAVTVDETVTAFVTADDDGEVFFAGDNVADYALGGGPDQFEGGPADDRVLGGAGNDILHGRGGNDELRGNAGNDHVQAGAGADTIDGGPDADRLEGGDGDDTYVVDHADDSVIEDADAGTDEVNSAISFTLDANLENLTLTGGGDTDATGNAQANVLTGNAGSNRLDGAAGADRLFGGDSNDTLIGGDGDDIIEGGATEADLRDTVFGGPGNDEIAGGYGNDQLNGGRDDDTLAGGFGADDVFGNAGDDVMTGSGFSDLLFGGPGFDFVNGGFGFDRVNGGDGGDRFFHTGDAGHGSDWIQDYESAEGDVLLYGDPQATPNQFRVITTETPNAGQSGVDEAFVVHNPTGQILWALVDGAEQEQINLRVGGQDVDLFT